MKRTCLASTAGLVILLGGAQMLAAELSDDTFAELRKLINPKPGESLWRHISWKTSLNAARRKAAAEGKPLLIWSGGGSAPLGGC